MTTERIYRTDVYAHSNSATVISVRESGGFDAIACDASVFYPEGGGQPSDRGTVSRSGEVYDVTSAHDESLQGEVWHYTSAPSGTFSVGDEVTLAIDFDHRFRNMQRHLGEHMLSGTMDTLFGGVNKGFHMGDDYITIDIDLGGRMLTDDELDMAELAVNDAVWADLPVRTEWFDDYESSLALPVRKKVPHDGRVSVVTVGDLPDPYDCIACCGTHPSRSSEVGLVAIYKCEPNKGMNRIYFDCGKCAKEKLTSDSRLLSDISKRYSCSPSDLISRLDSEADHISSLRASLAGLTAYVKEAEKARILRDISKEALKVFTYSSDILGTDDLLKLGFSVASEAEGILLIMKHKGSGTCLLISSAEEMKCGEIVKQFAFAHGGKGGGRNDNARALFGSAGDMESFVKDVIDVYE